MDARSAIAAARDYITETFADEGIFNVGLEELEFDDVNRIWSVTIGFSRPWDQVRNALFGTMSTAPEQARRAFKVVSLRDDGTVLSLKNREPVTS